MDDNIGERINLAEVFLRGEVVRVVFNNPENGYVVFRLADEQGVERVAVGTAEGVHEGLTVELRGGWESHQEHGRQFRFDSCRIVLPTSPEGITRYLGSGVFPGVGKKTAEAIVKRFGDKTMEIIERHSSRLQEVTGFGGKRLKAFREAWREQAEKREIFIFLQGHGISPAYCQRVYKTYGDLAVEVTRDDPYRLARDVDGIGFILADRVAASQGITGAHPGRLAAGVSYALEVMGKEGHVCFPRGRFVSQMAELLGVGEAEAAAGLDAAIAQRTAVAEPPDKYGQQDDMVYDAAMWRAEVELSKLLRSLAACRRHSTREIRGVPLPKGITLGSEQRQAIRNIKTHALSVITGGPGVGKTTVVGEIVRQVKAAGMKVYLAAPTGRAAKRLGESCGRAASTIHRLLKWDPVEGCFQYGLKRKLPCEVLIIDEVSMLDLNLALRLFEAVRMGTTVVLVGDADQLPSVGAGNFLADIIASGVCAVTHLTQIYRQASGSRIITNAHRVNRGESPDVSPPPRDGISDFYWIEQDDPEEVVKLVARLVSERIPERFSLDPMGDIQVLTPMNRGNCGAQALNEVLRGALNGGPKPQFQVGERVFKAGDRVMQIANNYDKKVFNGDMGRIVHVDSPNESFSVVFDGVKVDYELEDAKQLTLAYAVTVHKSQGSEFPAVVVPLLTQHYVMLRRNLVYTAMTRAKQLLVMVGSRKALDIAVKNYQTTPRHSLLRQRLSMDGRPAPRR